MGQLLFEKEHIDDKILVLTLRGSLDGSTVRYFDDELTSLFEQNYRFISINFRYISYINSTGLGALVSKVDKYQYYKGEISLFRVHPKVWDIFDMVGIASMIKIYYSKAESLNFLKKHRNCLEKIDSDMLLKSNESPPPPPPPPPPLTINKVKTTSTVEKEKNIQPKKEESIENKVTLESKTPKIKHKKNTENNIDQSTHHPEYRQVKIQELQPKIIETTNKQDVLTKGDKEFYQLECNKYKDKNINFITLSTFLAGILLGIFLQFDKKLLDINNYINYTLLSIPIIMFLIVIVSSFLSNNILNKALASINFLSSSESIDNYTSIRIFIGQTISNYCEKVCISAFFCVFSHIFYNIFIKNLFIGIFSILLFTILILIIYRKTKKKINQFNAKTKKYDYAEKSEIKDKLYKYFCPKEVLPFIKNKFFFSSKSLEEVGGDFFATYPIGKNWVGILIGDVMGHGHKANYWVNIIKVIISKALKINYSPAKIIKFVNDELYKMTLGETYSTIQYCLLNKKNNLLIFSNGGHLPILVYNNNQKKIRYIKNKGTAIGISGSSNYTENKIQLQQSDILVLFTDGITDQINDKNKQFGLKRLEKSIIKANTRNTEKIISTVKNELITFKNNAKQVDDMTIVSVDTFK